MYNNYLIHHGVKGMKWGVRKQRPPKGGIRGRYHGARAKMYRNSVKAVGNDAKSIKRYSAELRREGFSESEIRDSVKGLKKVQNNSLQKAKQHESKQQEYINRQTNSSKGLSSKQKETLKKVAIGAAVVAGVGLAAYGGVKMKNIRMNNQAAVGKRILNGDFLTRASLIDKAPIKSAINSGFNTANPTRVTYNGTKITNAKIKDSILGPQLRVSTSTVSKGTKPGVISTKELRTETIGRKGKGIYDTKEARKEYARAYRSMRKKGFK